MNQDSSDEDIQKGLGKRFFIQLLEDEKKFSIKIESIQQILDLLNAYAKCVEFFDTLGNPAKYYFMEKISNTIVEKEAFELMLKEEIKYQKEKEQSMKIKPILREGPTKQDPLKREPQQQKKQLTSLIQPSLGKHTIQIQNQEQKKISQKLIREARSKKLTITEKIYQQQNQMNQSMDIIQQWDEETNKADILIRQQLKQQEFQIQNRIAQRQKLKKQLPSNLISEISFDQYEFDT